MKRPIVLVVTRRTARKNRSINYVGEHHLELLIQVGTLPVMVPVVEGTLACVPQYAADMSGLLLVEGEDVEPRRYAAERANFTYLEKTDPLKDEIELRLLRQAMRRDLPILGICRGCQLLNVINGGTLYGDVQKEKKSHLKHIDQNYERYDSYRHNLTVVPRTPLDRWYRRKTLQANSYHHQGIRRLARRFAAMGHADDGLIEAYYDPRAEFVVGLQFHPERMLKDYQGNVRVWKAFGAAVRKRATLESTSAGPRRQAIAWPRAQATVALRAPARLPSAGTGLK